MSKQKKVANTLKTILDNTIMKNIMDRTCDITNVISEVDKWWSIDLFTRKPSSVMIEDGILTPSSLDMVAFLYTLAGRKSVLNLPIYESFRKKKFKAGQYLVSKENRHGEIGSIVSNKDTFIFSIKIKDMNILTNKGLGDFRSFSITDFYGNWYSGWNTLDFIPNIEENKFITENKLYIGNKIICKNFINPNRWISFYGQYYFMTKALIDRLQKEANFYKGQVKRMLNEGIVYPVSGEGKPSFPTKIKSTGEVKKIKVDAFNVEIDIPDDGSEFLIMENSQENLVKASKLSKKYIYTIIPKFKFMTRTTEYAWYKHGQGHMPGWLKNVKWEHNYKEKGKRIEWDRLILFQPIVGKKSVSIRKRHFQKIETVDKDY